MVCMHLSLHSKQAMYKNIRQPQHRKGHKMTTNNQNKDNVRNETTHMCFFIVCTKKNSSFAPWKPQLECTHTRPIVDL
jgi:hypothetical protein